MTPPSEEIPPAPLWFNPKRRSNAVVWSRSHDSAIAVAQQYSLNVDDIVAIMPDAWAIMSSVREQTDSARRRAVELTHLNSRRCNQWEDAGFDHSTRPGFDCAARTVAYECPESGLDPDSTDTPAIVWELIKAGAPKPLVKSGIEVALFAAEMLATSRPPSGEIVFAEWPELADDFDDIDNCDCSFNVDEFEELSRSDIDAPAEEQLNEHEATADDVPRNHIRLRARRRNICRRNGGRCKNVRQLFKPIPVPSLLSVSEASPLDRSRRRRIHPRATEIQVTWIPPPIHRRIPSRGNLAPIH